MPDCPIRLIYGLVDPVLNQIRYIGKSSNGLVRPRNHKTPCALKENNYKARWIRDLLSRGLCYDIAVLEICFDAQDLATAEQRWIRHARERNWPLTNLTDGGEGSIGWKAPPDTLLKMSLSRKGKKHSAEHRQHISDALRGVPRPSTPAFIKAQGLRNLGKKRDDKARANISNALRGKKKRPLTEEEKAHLSSVLKGRKQTPEHRARLNQALRTTHAGRCLITLNGRTETINNWIRITGLNRNTVYSRFYRGLSAEKVLAPVSPSRRISI